MAPPETATVAEPAAEWTAEDTRRAWFPRSISDRTLAPLLLLGAHDSQRLRDWIYWWLACLGVLASHPYGAFVLAAGIAAVLVSGWRSVRTWWICAVPVVLAVPFWIADLVLRDRFS